MGTPVAAGTSSNIGISVGIVEFEPQADLFKAHRDSIQEHFAVTDPQPRFQGQAMNPNFSSCVDPGWPNGDSIKLVRFITNGCSITRHLTLSKSKRLNLSIAKHESCQPGSFPMKYFCTRDKKFSVRVWSRVWWLNELSSSISLIQFRHSVPVSQPLGNFFTTRGNNCRREAHSSEIEQMEMEVAKRKTKKCWVPTFQKKNSHKSTDLFNILELTVDVEVSCRFTLSSCRVQTKGDKHLGTALS